jgi:hypothetical protein
MVLRLVNNVNSHWYSTKLWAWKNLFPLDARNSIYPCIEDTSVGNFQAPDMYPSLISWNSSSMKLLAGSFHIQTGDVLGTILDEWNIFYISLDGKLDMGTLLIALDIMMSSVEPRYPGPFLWTHWDSCQQTIQDTTAQTL